MTRSKFEPTLETPGSLIFLADDDDNQVYLFQEALRKASLSVALSVAKDGEEAVQQLKRHGQEMPPPGLGQPTFLLLDLNMPRMDGFEVLAWVKQQPEWAWLLVVVWSSSGESRDIEYAYRLGADVYISKPATFDELVQLAKSLNAWSAAWDRVLRFRPQVAGQSIGWLERPPGPVKDVVYE